MWNRVMLSGEGMLRRRTVKNNNGSLAWFSYVGKIPDDRGFYCFPTVPDKYPRSPGMDGDKSGESGAFLFSRRVPDFCDGRRSFPTNENSNLYRRGRRRWISLITNPPNCWVPVSLSRKFQFLAHFPFPAKFIGRIRERIVAIINNYWMRFLWYPE